MSPTASPEPAGTDGALPARRTSPRLSPPANTSLAAETPAPAPDPPTPEPACPICPSYKGTLANHIRRAHKLYPFLPSDFPPGTVNVCVHCGAVVRPTGNALALHKNQCPGQTDEMRTRLAGNQTRDAKGRTIGAPSASPIRRYNSGTSSSSPLRNSVSAADIPRPSPPPPPSPGRPPPTPAAQRASPADFYTEAASLADLLPLPGISKHLHPKLVRPVTDCLGRLAAAHTANPSRRTLFHILAFVKVGLVPAIQHGHEAVTARLAAYPGVAFPQVCENTSPPGNRFKRAKALVEAGLLSKAERALNDEAGIAPLTPATIAALQDKHPMGEANPFSLPLHAKTAYPKCPIDTDLANSLCTMDPGTSPGPSGWTVRLLTHAISAPAFLAFLTNLTAEIACGTALAPDLLCASRLTPLLKPVPPEAAPGTQPGIRPIAVGEIFYRLALRSIFSANFDTDFLSPEQYGVGSRGGVEPIVRAVSLATQGHSSFAYKHLIALDSANAFNTLHRSYLASSLRTHAGCLTRLAAWCYNNPTPLFVHAGNVTHTLLSAQGVRQGDPMGPLLFSIAIRPLVERLQALLGPNCKVLAYLDDIFILTNDPSDLQKAIDCFDAPDTPIALNPHKCQTYDLTAALTSSPVDILGTRVGSAETREAFLRDKTANLSSDLASLQHLPKQHALLILRRSIQHKLRHLLRTLQQDDLGAAWKEVDNAIWTAFDAIRGPLQPANREQDRILISLPPSMGGIGLASHATVAPLALTASHALADRVLSAIAPELLSDAPPVIQRQLCREVFTKQKNDLMASLQTHERLAMTEGASSLGRRWLETLPSAPRFELSDGVVQASLAYRTLLPGHRGACTRCAQPNLVGHDEWCSGRKDFRVTRHEAIKYRLANGLRSAPHLTVSLEPYVFGGTGRRNDIRIDNCGEGNADLAAEEYDIKIVCLSAPSHIRELHAISPDPDLMGDTRARVQTVLAQEARRKQARLPAAAATPFLPLVFSSGGIMENETRTKMLAWKKWGVPASAFEWMMTSLSVALARARGRTFRTAP